jgi:hypothetical protein
MGLSTRNSYGDDEEEFYSWLCEREVSQMRPTAQREANTI